MSSAFHTETYSLMEREAINITVDVRVSPEPAVRKKHLSPPGRRIREASVEVRRELSLEGRLDACQVGNGQGTHDSQEQNAAKCAEESEDSLFNVAERKGFTQTQGRVLRPKTCLRKWGPESSKKEAAR